MATYCFWRYAEVNHPGLGFVGFGSRYKHTYSAKDPDTGLATMWSYQDYGEAVMWQLVSSKSEVEDWDETWAISIWNIVALRKTAPFASFYGFYHKGTKETVGSVKYESKTTAQAGIDTPTIDGYSTSGWYVKTPSSGIGAQDITDIVAVFGLKFTMVFDPNGGGGTMANAVRTMGAYPYRVASDGANYSAIPACTFTNSDSTKVFAGWSTTPDGEVVLADGAEIDEDFYNALKDYVTVGNSTSYTFYAQWRDKSIVVTKKNAGDDGEAATAAGTLQLFSDADGYAEPVAEEAEDGTLSFDGVKGRKYRLSCSMDATADFGWTALGVESSGSYATEYDIDFSKAVAQTSVEYCFRRKALYSVVVQSANGTVTVSPAQDADGGRYYSGRALSFAVEPSVGYEVAGTATVVNADSGDVNTITVTDNAFAIDALLFNAKVVVDYAQIDYVLAAGIHEASRTAITAVAITNADGATTATAHYGDAATFTATVADGYSFAGWYDADGACVSTDAAYSVTVAGEVSLTARAKVACSLGLAYSGEGSQTCSLTVDGAAYALGTAFDVVLGDSFSYALALGERADGVAWLLDNWKSADGTVLLYGESGTVSPTAAFSMTATVGASVARRLVVYAMKIDAATNTATSYTGIASPETPFTCFVANEALAQSADESDGGATLAGTTPPTVPVAFVSFDYDRTTLVRFTAATSVTFKGDNEEGQNFRFLSLAPNTNGGAVPDETDILTYENAADILLATTETAVYAYYGTAVSVKVAIDYAAASDATMGAIAITAATDADAAIADDARSVTAMQGTSISLSATPTNGYKFVGWFSYREAAGDPFKSAASASVRVATATTIYAKFAKDTTAVCEWEGSATNKALVWRSKTYESSKPFNPSACRVDALGYAAKSLLELTVAMFSAPDAEATATATLTNISSQDARRLPIRRQERYMQVAVKANVEVDALLVGTSMGGLKS